MSDEKMSSKEMFFLVGFSLFFAALMFTVLYFVIEEGEAIQAAKTVACDGDAWRYDSETNILTCLSEDDFTYRQYVVDCFKADGLYRCVKFAYQGDVE